VQGHRSDDGKTWTFAAGALLSGTVLNVVFEPADGANFAVTFNPPSASTASTTPKPARPAVSPSSDQGATEADLSSPDIIDTGDTLVPPSVTPSDSGATEIALDVAPPSQLGNAALRAPSVALPTSTRRVSGLALVMLLMAVTAAVALSRVPTPAVRALGPISTPSVGAVERRTRTQGVAQVGGLGRFARPRLGPPPKL
jgi:hypothetical protein